jgi:phosphatidylethanolamine/phosphatidyl-N-methylethanolamine N-methyltransferase
VSLGATDHGRIQHYDRLAAVYDRIFGLGLQSGRAQSTRDLPLWPGDTVLEIGIGTGLTATHYPVHCSVMGIDLSAKMLERAARRLAQKNLRHVRLLQMDAAAMAFPDGTFALVYAAYVLTTVPDPIAVVAEMRRVCRPGGRIVFLNHFLSDHPAVSWCERAISPLTRRMGFRTDLSLADLLARTSLVPVCVQQMNSGLLTLVTCAKPLDQPQIDALSPVLHGASTVREGALP